MHHIIYLSRATYPFTDAQLQDLLAQARPYNAAHGITGVLLYGNDQFLQLVEGEETEVRALYEHIRQDSRHQDITTFADKAIAERAFPDWSMAYQPLKTGRFQELIGYLSPAIVHFENANMSLTDQQLLQLLRTFVLPEEA